MVQGSYYVLSVSRSVESQIVAFMTKLTRWIVYYGSYLINELLREGIYCFNKSYYWCFNLTCIMNSVIYTVCFIVYKSLIIHLKLC